MPARTTVGREASFLKKLDPRRATDTILFMIEFTSVKRRSVLLAGLLLTVSLSGCLGPRRSDYVSSEHVQVPQSSEQADRYWEAIQETLRGHRYRLDRVDRRMGVVTTMPELSQHFFEFWRRDVDTNADLFESTLNPIRRWVEVRVNGDSGEDWEQLTIRVHKERLSTPDRQFNSSAAAYRLFGSNLPTTTGQDRVTPDADEWLSIGRDPAMEDLLLRQILERVERA